MTDNLNVIRQSFLKCLNDETLDTSSLKNQVSIYSQNQGDITKTCQVSIHYPQMIHGDLDESFPRSIMQNCNDLLVSISGGNQENPPHKGGWVDNNHLFEDKMIDVKYDVKIEKLCTFVKQLHSVIYTIQTQLKQISVYVRIDDEKIHADTAKMNPDSFPSPEEFRPTPSDSQGEVLLENVVIGGGSTKEIRIGKLSIRDGSAVTLIANLMQISGGF